MRVTLVLLSCFAVVACKKSPEPAPDTPPAKAVAAPAPKPVPPPAAPVDAAVSTLSVFEPKDGACEWRKVVAATGQSETLASLPGTCVGVRVGFSPDATKAVVWFEPTWVQLSGYFSEGSSKPGYEDEKADDKGKPRAFLVDVTAKKAEPLALPSHDGQSLASLGVDGKGVVLAFLEQRLPDDVVNKGTITFEGEAFDLKQFSEGLPELAHAYRYDGTTWKHAETKATTTGWDYAMGVQELEAFRSQGARSDDLSAAHAQGDAVDKAELAALNKLAPAKAKSADDGEWIFLGVGTERLYAWEVTGEFAYTTGLVAAGSPPQVLPKLGFTDGDLVAIRSSGPYALIAAANVGAHPRLYQLPGAKLVYSSDTARAVTFWPTTAKPVTHED